MSKKQRPSATVVIALTENNAGAEHADAVAQPEPKQQPSHPDKRGKCCGSVQCNLIFTQDLSHDIDSEDGDHKGCCTRSRIAAERASATCCGNYSRDSPPPLFTCRRSFGHMLENRFFQLFLLVLIIADVMSVFFELYGTHICTNKCYDEHHDVCLGVPDITKHMLKNCRSHIVVDESIIANGSIVHNYENGRLQCPQTRVLNDEWLDYTNAVLHITSISILWFLMAHIFCLAIAFDITFFMNPILLLDFFIVGLSLVFEYAVEFVEFDFALIFLAAWRGVRLVHGFYAAQHGSSHIQGEGLTHKLQSISARVGEGRQILDEEYEDAVQAFQDKLGSLDTKALQPHIDEFIEASFGFKSRLSEILQQVSKECDVPAHGGGDHDDH